MKKNEAQVIELTPEELKAFRDRVNARALKDSDYELIMGLADTVEAIRAELEKKNASIRRLQKLIFGPTTEKTDMVLKTAEADTSTEAPPAEGEDTSPAPPKKRKGHGRNGAAAYVGAERVPIPHHEFVAGDPCPDCHKGRVYPIREGGRKLIRIRGQAPLTAKVCLPEDMRCNLCGTVFRAKVPAEIGTEKYHVTAASMVVMLKYGSGFPFKRLEVLQASVGVPLPASVQWEIAARLAGEFLPVYEELLRWAAQAGIVHNDDTAMRILGLASEIFVTDEDGKVRRRTGVYTTAIVAVGEGWRIALFFTGWKHAGENLRDLLEKRQKELPPPKQMCDGLSHNVPKGFEVILGNCLAHARRKYADVAVNFPEECRFVLETLRDVYQNDDIAKEQNMSDQERLEFHQAESGPLMDTLEKWLHEQFDKKKVEPNSGLGEAISYMLAHWKPLTLFLREPGAALDNNIAERALKMVILNRKNAYYYRTENGARVGDIHMSILHTCRLAGVNPYEYLNALQLHAAKVKANPSAWLPWNYQATLATLSEPAEG